MLGGERDRGIRETRQGFGHLIEAPDAAEIGKGDEKRRALARVAQRRHDRCVIRGERGGARHILDQALESDAPAARQGRREANRDAFAAMRERKGE